MKVANSLIPVFTALLVSACGGGSSNNSTEDDNTGANPEQSPSTTLQTGRFVDSAVVGLSYTTASVSGVTRTDGAFDYEMGENVTFSIGDITLPATPGADIITPLSVFSTSDITDTRVTNLARLLQTLDTDGDPVNGITVSDSAIASATGLNVDFSSAEFENQVVNLVANSGSSSTTLIGGQEALAHLQETLFVEGIEERPPVNTASHPAVGSSAEFVNIAHGVSGTLTVIDDRTLQITNFNYDGLGPEVFFYTGTDGNYRDNGARSIGSQLNGRAYIDETITLTIPSSLTLDDFNGLSVWCVEFSANFGDAQF